MRTFRKLCRTLALIVLLIVNPFLYFMYYQDTLNYEESNIPKQLTVNKSLEKKIEFNLPSFTHYFQHLKNSFTNLQPTLCISKNRNASFVIGIPTAKRHNASYVLETLHYLFNALNDEDKSETLVIVQIAESDEDPFYVSDTVRELFELYKDEIDSGLLDIIVASKHFYPDIKKYIETHTNPYKDDLVRYRWRTKQTFDFAYLMSYSYSRGKYYLQLEDDVICAFRFIKKMKDAIARYSDDDNWILYEFSYLGFIGKLFKTNQLPLFIHFFIMFAYEKPVDWLLEDVLRVKHCFFEDYDCGLKITNGVQLFQHFGVQSSLDGKIQNIKSDYFDNEKPKLKHRNPKANITTTFEQNENSTIYKVYYHKSYFRSTGYHANETILFEFKQPIKLKRYFIKSGNYEFPDEKFYNATLEAQFVEDGVIKNNEENERFIVVGSTRTKSGFLVGDLPIKLPKIRKLRLKILDFYSILIDEIRFTKYRGYRRERA